MNKLLLVILAIVLLSTSAFRMRQSAEDKPLADACEKCYPNIPGDFDGKGTSSKCPDIHDKCVALAKKYDLI